jgi:hypothetical protein
VVGRTPPPESRHLPVERPALDESSELLEYSATAVLFKTMQVTTTLQVSVGEIALEIPVEG